MGTRQHVTKFYKSSGLAVSDVVIPFVAKPKVLGVTLDSHLSFDDHITGVVRACNYHLRALHHIRHLIDREAANTMACSIVCSRLDYCNSVLYGVTDANIGRLQRVQNSLARVVYNAPYRSSATALRRTLHWLPIKERISYKIAMLTFKVRLHQQPTYLAELIVDYIPSWSLRSSGTNLLVEPRKKTLIASRAFSCASPHIWNSLPPAARSSTSFDTFRRHVKTFLFDVAYNGHWRSITTPLTRCLERSSTPRRASKGTAPNKSYIVLYCTSCVSN